MKDRAWVAVCLAFVAGGVDVIGFLTMMGLFVAHMSGNSAALGAAVGGAADLSIARRFFPIPVFVVGVMGGVALNHALALRPAARRLAAVCAVEAVLLAVFALWGHAVSPDGTLPSDPAWRFYLLAALPVLAMGMQNTSLERVGTANVHTTFVTGILMSLGTSVARALLDQEAAEHWRNARIYGAVWSAYLAGAVACAGLHRQVTFGATALPLAVLVVLVVAGAWEPTPPARPTPPPPPTAEVA